MPNPERGGSKPPKRTAKNQPKRRAMDFIGGAFIVPLGPGNKRRNKKGK